jgi:hypothetical protein
MSHVSTAAWQDFLAEHGAGRPFDVVVTTVLPFGASRSASRTPTSSNAG